MKKGILFVSVFLAMAAAAFAGPGILTYQGSLLTSADNNPVANGTYDIQFTIFDQQAPGGTNLWSETDNAVQVTNGLFSTILGNGTVFPGNLFSANPNLYLEVIVDIDGDSSFEAAETFGPRQRLTSAPWAIDADRLGGQQASDFAAAIHDHDARYYTETELSASGGGGQVHWNNLVGVPPLGGGDITAVIAGPGLAGGAISGDATVEVTTGGIINRMIADQAVTEHKLRMISAGAGNSTTWATISRRWIDQISSTTYAQAYIILNGESEGGAGSVRVRLDPSGGTPIYEVTTYTVPSGGFRPWTYVSPPFPIGPGDTVDFEYQAVSASNPLIWREVGLVFVGGELPGPIAIEGSGTGERLNVRTGDINGVDDLRFDSAAGPYIDLAQGYINNVSTIYFEPDPTFSVTYGHRDMMNLDDNDDDFVYRMGAYAYVWGGVGPTFTSWIGTGVHIPDGATVTQLDAWVYDNDAAGSVNVTLHRHINNGSTQVTMASVATTFAGQDANVQQLTDSAIVSGTIDNDTYRYSLYVMIDASAAGISVRYYATRIQFTMPRVAW